VVVALIYVANGRSVGAGDTLPSRYLPFSLLRAHDFTLDEFPLLHGDDARRTFPVQGGVPYYLSHRGGHYYSAYSPGPGVLALPVYALPVLLGVSDVWAPALEKTAAAVMTALSVVLLFLALVTLIGGRWALAIALIYAFGTSSWSVSSQALWQHGPSQLFLALLLLCLARGLTDPRFLGYAGFAAAGAVVMRPTDVLIAFPVAAGVCWLHPRAIPRFVLYALPPLLGLAVYNLVNLGSLTGGTGTITAPVWSLFAQVPTLRGLAGVLVSPGRGLFVYSPVLLFSVVGLIWVALRGPALFRPLVAGVALVILVVGKWFIWWGGYSWGPRLLADIAPILCFFLYPLTGILDRHRVLKAAFVVLAAFSMAAHGLGAFLYDQRWDHLADVGRTDASLWSWRRGPIPFYAHEAVAAPKAMLSAARGGPPTSADSGAALAASYRVTPIAADAFVGEPIVVSVEATNTGRAVWLASAPGGRGAVLLGWRWSRDGVDVAAGRVPLTSDVLPGETARFDARIAPPPVRGDYVLTIDLVSELIVWFAGQGGTPTTVAVRVRPPDLHRWLTEPVAPGGAVPTAAIATDRTAYRRGQTLHLTVEARNPAYPSGKFDVYLIREAPDGTVRFYDGRRFGPDDGTWSALVRALPMPALVVGRFALPLADETPGAYRWHVILTGSGTHRPLARATAAFGVEP
jgi:hypothetical protein